ncbi:hypothetical protein KSP39_PZI009827 [Platanthera zijinensis]|uniref:Uncharacterized protein n=1 Tax=Platanthera zijinensis TaxID=2320716 RepID=A0AAP0BJJ4_9ASPA
MAISPFSLVVAERVTSNWIEGPKEGQLEVLAHLLGFPDNVRINEKGQFWVAIDCCRTRGQEFLSRNPWLGGVYFKIPMKLEFRARKLGMMMYTARALFDEAGDVVDVNQDREGRLAPPVRTSVRIPESDREDMQTTCSVRVDISNPATRPKPRPRLR